MSRVGALIVRANSLSLICSLLSLTRTVKLKVFAVVGVPLNTPPLLNDSPGGSAPATTVQLNGCVPPVAANDVLYATPTVPGGSGLDVVMTSAGGLIVRANGLSNTRPPVSLTRTVKLEVVAVVGVPLNTPPLLNDSPGGSVPVTTLQLYGAVPPVAANVWLYAVPTVPGGSVLGVVMFSGGGLIVSVNAFMAVCAAAPAALSVA
jgi:hypothetical protein